MTEHCAIGLHDWRLVEDGRPVQTWRCQECKKTERRPYQAPQRQPYDPYAELSD